MKSVLITSSICIRVVNPTVTCLTQGIFTGYISMTQQKGTIAFTCQNNYFCHFMLYTRLTYLLLNRLVVKTSIKRVLAVHSVWPTCLRGSEKLKVPIFKSAFLWSMKKKKKKISEIEENLEITGKVWQIHLASISIYVCRFTLAHICMCTHRRELFPVWRAQSAELSRSLSVWVKCMQLVSKWCCTQ